MDKFLFRNNYLAIIERDGYTFSREVRCNGIIVSLLPFRSKDRATEYLARLEICPAHSSEFQLCSITGGLESSKTIEETAKAELWDDMTCHYHGNKNSRDQIGKNQQTVLCYLGVGNTFHPPQHSIEKDDTHAYQNSGVDIYIKKAGKDDTDTAHLPGNVCKGDKNGADNGYNTCSL